MKNLKTVIAVVLCAGLLFPAACGEQAPSAGVDPAVGPDTERPNVILITADDLGWKDLGCYGNQEIRTPNLDRLAQEGVRFENAFVMSSSCSPSRASIMTGQYPHTHGVMGLAHRHPDMALPTNAVTMASLLQEAGYHTALQGKWHVAPYSPPDLYGYHDRLSGILPDDHRIRAAWKTREFIRENRDRPFFLEINYMNNHRDMEGNFKYHPDHPVDPDSIRVPEYWALPDWPQIRKDVARYYSQTMKMDSMIGKVLAELDELGLAEKTIIIFVSDNGPPFPGNKMTSYDRGIGTPLLVRWPGRVQAGVSVDSMVTNMDILPTLLRILGLPVPQGVQGRSFHAHLLEQQAPPIHDALFPEMTYHVDYLPSRAVRTSEWKYIRNYSDIAVGLDQNCHQNWAHRLCELPDQPWKLPRVEEELYHLATDPNEQVNLAADPAYRPVLETLRERLDKHLEATGDPFFGAPFTHDYVFEWC